MKYAWIREQTEYPVRRLCQALNVSASGYYAWRDRKPGPRAQANARLLERIRRLHVQSREAYGALRLWQALRREGEACGRHRVRLLRRADGIQAKRRQDRRVYMDSSRLPSDFSILVEIASVYPACR